MPSLAPTTFQTGIDETLVAVDVYTQTGIDIINGFLQEVSADVSALSLMETIDVPFNMDGINSAIDEFVNGIPSSEFVGPPDLTSSLSISAPGIMSSIGMLTDTVKSAVTQVGSIVNEVTTTINGVVSTVSAAAMSTVSGITGIVAGLTNTAAGIVKDVSAYVQTASNTIVEAAKVGISGVYTAIASAASTTLPMLEKITSNILPNIIATSNIKLLTEVALGPVAFKVNLMKPNLIGQFLTNFKQPFTSLKKQIKDTQTTLKSNYAQMKTAFNAISPQWQQTKRNLKSVLNAKAFTTASKQAVASIKANVSANANNIAVGLAVAAVNNSYKNLNTTPNTANEAYMLMAANVPVTSVETAIAGEIPAVMMA
jgi:hypothetical protein